VTAEAELAELAEHVRNRATSPDIAWGVLLDGSLALTGGTTASSTVFRIASMTKSFTAATTLARRDRGELRLDDEIGLLRGQRATTDSPPVTIRDVLSMSAGLATDDPWADRHLDMDPHELAQLVHTGVRFARPTGTAYEYSNLGYALLGDVSAHTADLLLHPLGLERTTWTQPEHDDWARPPGEDPLGHGALAGMGGLWSNVEDLARWIAFLDDAFPARDDPDDAPLRRSSRREMQQVHRARPLTRSDAHGEGLDHTPARIDAGGYGYGLQVVHDDRFGAIVGHGGGLPGYGSHMRWLPGRRVGVVALANSTYAPMGRLTRRMLELLDDHGLVPTVVVSASPDVRRAAEDLVALLQSWDDDTAYRIFADNVALDEPYPPRAARAAALVAEHRELHLEAIVAASGTDGTATVRGDRGTFTVSFLLAPIAGGGIEHYDVNR
jgi:CubicO group peptidase (beta-lactamase class C family)